MPALEHGPEANTRDLQTLARILKRVTTSNGSLGLKKHVKTRLEEHLRSAIAILATASASSSEG
jgi:hypothetical protein